VTQKHRAMRAPTPPTRRLDLFSHGCKRSGSEVNEIAGPEFLVRGREAVTS
jgi:hypothetical protein